MSVILFQLLISLILGGAVFFLIYALFRYPVPAEPPTHRRLALALGIAQRHTLFEQRYLAPLLSLAVNVAHRFSFGWVRRRIRQDLNAAGNPHGYSIEEYIALCLVSAAGLGLASSLLAIALLNRFELFILMIMTVLGFLLPIWTLNSAAHDRLLCITKKLPYTLDLIALMMEAGSTFTEAVSTMIRDEPDDAFNQELKLVQAEIDLGTTRSQALANMAERIPLDSVRSIVGAVNQAEALGTPLSLILKNQSGMLRMYRSVRAEKLSASASLRILIPSMLILIAVVLILFGPMIIHYVEQGKLF